MAENLVEKEKANIQLPTFSFKLTEGRNYFFARWRSIFKLKQNKGLRRKWKIRRNFQRSTLNAQRPN